MNVVKKKDKSMTTRKQEQFDENPKLVNRSKNSNTTLE